MSFIFDPGKDARRDAKRVRQEEEARQARLDAGVGDVNQAFAGFDDNFYKGRSDAYNNFARPQIDDQFSDARKDLVFALSRGGKLDSSVAADRFGNLDEIFTKGLQDVSSKGLDFASQARGDVEDSRASIINQLFATEDTDLAVSQALNRTKALQATPSFGNVGNIFQNITAGLAAAGNNPNTGYGGFLGGTTNNASKEKVIA